MNLKDFEIERIDQTFMDFAFVLPHMLEKQDISIGKMNMVAKFLRKFMTSNSIGKQVKYIQENLAMLRSPPKERKDVSLPLSLKLLLGPPFEYQYADVDGGKAVSKISIKNDKFKLPNDKQVKLKPKRSVLERSEARLEKKKRQEEFDQIAMLKLDKD